MKKISKKIFVIVILCLLFVNCSSDSPNTNPLLDRIIGKWQRTVLLSENPLLYEFVDNGSVLEFKENRTFKSYLSESPSNYQDGTYTISQEGIIVFTYNLPDNFTEENKIKNCDETELILSGDLSPDGKGCFEGCEIRYQKIVAQ